MSNMEEIIDALFQQISMESTMFTVRQAM